MTVEVVESEDIKYALQKPFLEKDVEWRIQSSGIKNGKPWAKVLCYLTNRGIQNRLDDVFGVGGWQNDFKAGPMGGLLCGISARVGIEWITKFDGSQNTQVEEIKGGLSSSMKRAAVQWGIGRYLYDLGDSWAVFSDSGTNSAKIKDKYSGEEGWFKWSPPRLPQWALPKISDLSLMEKQFTDLINQVPENKRSDWYSAWRSEQTPAGKTKILTDLNTFFKAGTNG